MDNEPYHILGHSFGGFIAGRYVLKYPKNVQSLLLLSSVGVTGRPEHMTTEAIHERQTDCWGRYGVNWMDDNWVNGNFSLFEPLRIIGRVAAHKLIH
jgi:pimeloyl-ACP methyl ester carboxylesterase